MFYRRLFSADHDADRSAWAHVKVQASQHSSELPDDPPAVFVGRPLVTVKFDQARLGVAKLGELESLRGDAELFFDLGAVNRMSEGYIEFVTDRDGVTRNRAGLLHI
jgi:hypothetical protein